MYSNTDETDIVGTKGWVIPRWTEVWVVFLTEHADKLLNSVIVYWGYGGWKIWRLSIYHKLVILERRLTLRFYRADNKSDLCKHLGGLKSHYSIAAGQTGRRDPKINAVYITERALHCSFKRRLCKCDNVASEQKKAFEIKLSCSTLLVLVGLNPEGLMGVTYFWNVQSVESHSWQNPYAFFFFFFFR